ncbi:MAG TPA: exodeoxyribonuclease VII small subunit [bacterium]|nr:exodeoxyribonuclease VII small subunit [Myxococcales bacterium]OQA60237.1 MAG: Exodeoxyribonuclease 7 small subunit [bacterium ADurb.Bin270]HPW44810.1 exodeoxyribonuclease VII small subunit [bacterium]HQC50252.1 exodeoxyribonuclease VII small subunit [bacterium]HQH80114.1 exodeoxyribonuclease VII small subunit [bacterium]
MSAKKSFEESMADLEKIVRKLEAGDISLDDSLSEFEKGVSLLRDCEKKLDEAKGKVEQLINDASGGIRSVSFEIKE